MGKEVFFIIALFLISIPLISNVSTSSSFGYNNPNLPHLQEEIDIFSPVYIFAYTNNTINVVVPGTWYNITFDHQEYLADGINHTWNDSTNYSFYITQAGTYDVIGTASIIDTSVNAEDHIMVYRVIKNGVEVHGSLWEGDFSRPDSSSKRNFNVFVECSIGDSLGLQFTGTDIDIKLFPRDSTGYGDDHAHSASITIKRVA